MVLVFTPGYSCIHVLLMTLSFLNPKPQLLYILPTSHDEWEGEERKLVDPVHFDQSSTKTLPPDTIVARYIHISNRMSKCAATYMFRP